MTRIAAVGDIHLGVDDVGLCRRSLSPVVEEADLLLLAGDLTRIGTTEEAAVVAKEVGGLGVPTVAVLGNHDHHSNHAPEVTEILVEAGIQVLEGAGTVVDANGGSVGVAGVKGFGGGFIGKCATAFGEAETKAFIRTTERAADSLREALLDLDTDVRVALTHYSPVSDTLRGEPKEIYPFLGSWLLAKAIDEGGADVAFHGHAHYGSERGTTAGGVRVRNVARPVIDAPYKVYDLSLLPTRAPEAAYVV